MDKPSSKQGRDRLILAGVVYRVENNCSGGIRSSIQISGSLLPVFLAKLLMRLGCNRLFSKMELKILTSVYPR